MPRALRRNQILERIQRDGGVSITELAREYDVSRITVHRDLEDLARDGLVVRVHGGARAVDSARGDSPEAAIAAHAAELVEAGSTIFVEASAPTLALARLLIADSPDELTLVTNSPTVANEVVSERVHVVVCPGELDQGLRMLAGRWTVEFLQELNFDLAFVSASGVSLEAGLTTSRRPLADVINAARAVATRTVGLIESSRFGRSALVSVADAQELDVIITDSGLEPELAERYRAAGVRLEIVDV